ncbi:MAG TPA: hypothetical protein VI136_07230 [Verrucomicrobiae bacterium]
MRIAALALLAAVTAFVLTGCVSQQARLDSGKIRTAYTTPADESAPVESNVWALSPAIEP